MPIFSIIDPAWWCRKGWLHAQHHQPSHYRRGPSRSYRAGVHVFEYGCHVHPRQRLFTQCMGLLWSSFNNLKSAQTMLARRFPALPDADPPLDALPYITQQTVAYALSLVISCVCYSVNDPMTKGRAPHVYRNLWQRWQSDSLRPGRRGFDPYRRRP